MNLNYKINYSISPSFQQHIIITLSVRNNMTSRQIDTTLYQKPCRSGLYSLSKNNTLMMLMKFSRNTIPDSMVITLDPCTILISAETKPPRMTRVMTTMKNTIRIVSLIGKSSPSYIAMNLPTAGIEA